MQGSSRTVFARLYKVSSKNFNANVWFGSLDEKRICFRLVKNISSGLEMYFSYFTIRALSLRAAPEKTIKKKPRYNPNMAKVGGS